jgi:hypothetical protein
VLLAGRAALPRQPAAPRSVRRKIGSDLLSDFGHTSHAWHAYHGHTCYGYACYGYTYYGRYDETDFDDMVTTLRGIGAWLVDASPGYVSPF